MKIKVCWAAKMVTWSCYLVEVENTKFLVDCGMFQWPKEVVKMNYNPFLFDPKEVDFMLLTHAHIDHCGLIPKLHKEWFTWNIYATSATIDLVEILLEDSANIQEENIKQENRRRQRINLKPRLPLYTEKDAKKCMKLFKKINYNNLLKINENISVRYQDAGHIIWSASIEVFVKEWSKNKKIVFSWDLGQRDIPIVENPTLIEETDYLFIESTYWDRVHQDFSSKEELLLKYAKETYDKWWKLLIPSFAVERTQELLYFFNKLIKKWQFPKEKIFLDSPLSIKATEIFKNHRECFDEEALNEYSNPFDSKNLEYLLTIEDSRKLNDYQNPCVIIAWNWMCTAWRIRHHLKHGLRDRKNTLLFVWYQAEGTLWRQILEWEHIVKMMWIELAVNLDICKINSFSGHADSNQLIRRAKWFTNPPKKTFIMHWEWNAQLTMKENLKNIWFDSEIPSIWDEIEI